MNAKEEFLRKLSDINKTVGDIKCATIKDENFGSTKEYAKLNVNFNTEDYSNFLRSLDFNYDSGYGVQELGGLVWFTDNTWLSRGEYNGSEWWVHNKVPEVPGYLNFKTN